MIISRVCYLVCFFLRVKVNANADAIKTALIAPDTVEPQPLCTFVTYCNIYIVTFCYNNVKSFLKIGERNMKNLGLVGLKIVRKQRKYNQLKVDMDLNISREALSHYENGKRSPDIQMLRRLSEYFNVSIDFLVNGKEFDN